MNSKNVCRICLSTPKTTHLFHIFHSREFADLPKKLQRCLPFQIDSVDGISPYICNSCIYELDIVYDFLKNAIRSNLLLQSYKSQHYASQKTTGASGDCHSSNKVNPTSLVCLKNGGKSAVVPQQQPKALQEQQRRTVRWVVPGDASSTSTAPVSTSSKPPSKKTVEPVSRQAKSCTNDKEQRTCTDLATVPPRHSSTALPSPYKRPLFAIAPAPTPDSSNKDTKLHQPWLNPQPGSSSCFYPIQPVPIRYPTYCTTTMPYQTKPFMPAEYNYHQWITPGYLPVLPTAALPPSIPIVDIPTTPAMVTLEDKHEGLPETAAIYRTDTPKDTAKANEDQEAGKKTAVSRPKVASNTTKETLEASKTTTATVTTNTDPSPSGLSSKSIVTRSRRKSASKSPHSRYTPIRLEYSTTPKPASSKNGKRRGSEQTLEIMDLNNCPICQSVVSPSTNVFEHMLNSHGKSWEET